MRDFACPVCGQRLAFENSLCLRCGSEVGVDLETRAFLQAGSGTARACANADLAGCNWLVADGQRYCGSCRLTRTRPADDDLDAMPAFAAAERAKRRLVLELSELDLPVEQRDPVTGTGLCFDLLSSAVDSVVTGHANGLITLDLAEGDDVHREQLRISMAEPYRTLLGHMRHEVGHYYFTVLAESGAERAEFEHFFGDPDLDYQAALDRHYSSGAPAGWEDVFVSSYATMHPAEDWAETFAHYLHVRDTIDTAAAFGFAPSGLTLPAPVAGDLGFDRLVETWLPLTWSLNMLNRSMGHSDLYPFVLPGPVLDKMRFVHRLVAGARPGA